jgi:hypothetical protein
MQYKLSKSDWKQIGKKMGWLKTADFGMPSPMSGPVNGDKPSGSDKPLDEQPKGEQPVSENDVFSYLTELEPRNTVLMKLRRKAESLLEMGNDPEDLHKALHWALYEDNRYQSTGRLVPHKPSMERQLRHESEHVQILKQSLTRTLDSQ